MAEVLLKLIASQSLSERLLSLQQIYPKANSTAGMAEWQLWQLWLGLARDLLLIKQGQLPLIQHWFLRERLVATAEQITWLNLLTIFTNLGAARQYLLANVQPNLVFHNLAAGN